MTWCDTALLPVHVSLGAEPSHTSAIALLARHNQGVASAMLGAFPSVAKQVC